MIEIETGKLMSPTFWKAFNAMMEVKEFSPAEKVRIVNLKKYLGTEYETAREVVGTIYGDQDKITELYKTPVKLGDFSDLFKEKFLAEHLTAGQLFELSDFIKE